MIRMIQEDQQQQTYIVGMQIIINYGSSIQTVQRLRIGIG